MKHTDAPEAAAFWNEYNNHYQNYTRWSKILAELYVHYCATSNNYIGTVEYKAEKSNLLSSW